VLLTFVTIFAATSAILEATVGSLFNAGTSVASLFNA
jgi:hypothetical protein